MVVNLFPFQDCFSLGKGQKSQGTKSGLKRGWVTWMTWCFAKKFCTRCDAWAGTSPWWSCQSPVAHSCHLLNHRNSFHTGMFWINAKFDADLLLYSVGHFECDGRTVHMLTPQHLLPAWLVQWSCHSLRMWTMTCHFPWLPGYISVAQTILIMLTMVGLFSVRPCICAYLLKENPRVHSHTNNSSQHLMSLSSLSIVMFL